MVFCTKCEENVEAEQEDPTGYLVCTKCGTILDQSSWSIEPTFTKEGGESTVAGHFVSNNAGSHGLGRISGGRVYGLQYDATEKTSGKAKAEIDRQVDILGIRPRDDVCNAAHRLYMLAVQHNFNRGRRTAQIAAACIYIICRQDNHPFMLLDFSDALQVNVFVLGAVFLQLCKVLRLEEHAIMTRPVDPSLFLHRFADRMRFGKKMHQVANTALRLVSSMKRDWLQTGRRPAGICGAALYIAGHIHGFHISKSEIIKIVHVGEATLDKRVSEFANTPASKLTVGEFEEQSKELEAEEQRHLKALEPIAALQAPDGPIVHGCEHLRNGLAMFAHGMCKDCYMHFIKVTGGMHSTGANPPAFMPSRNNAALALEHEHRHALPAYAGEGAPEEEANDEDDVEAELENALADEELGALAQAIVPSQSSGASQITKPRPKRKSLKALTSEQPTSKRRRAPSSSPAQDVVGPQAERAIVQAGSVTAAPAQNVGALRSKQIVGQAGSPPEVPVQAAVGPRAEQAVVEAGPPQLAPAQQENTCRDITEFAEPAKKARRLLEDTELSDLSDDEEYLNTAQEAAAVEKMWTAMNHGYIEQQKLKAAIQQKPKEEVPLIDMGGKKPRGRPKGSKTKPRPEETMEPAETALDSLKNMLQAKKLSSKINYENLESLFDGASHVPAAQHLALATPEAAQAPSASDGQFAASPASEEVDPPSGGSKRPRKRRPAIPKPPSKSAAGRTAPRTQQPHASAPTSLRASPTDLRAAPGSLRAAPGSLRGTGLGITPGMRSTLAPLPGAVP